MCKQHNPRKIDKCMKTAIRLLNLIFPENIKILVCCCGHKKYHSIIVFSVNNQIFELFSGVKIPRKKRFYVKDKQGYFYIPEVENQ